MKTLSSNAIASVRRRSAFTLTEIMVAMGILVMVLGAVISLQLFGLKMHQLARAKLGANQDARHAISLLTGEVRSAKIVRIGNASDATSFVEVPAFSPQQGNAIRIFPTTNTSAFIQYFLDATDNTLKRSLNGDTAVAVIADHVSNNAAVFRCEDHAGNLYSDNRDNRVISLMLQFYQIQYPIIKIGPKEFFDYYQLSTKMTPRNLE